MDSTAGGETRFNRPFMGSAISTCFGSARCVVSSRLVLNNRYTWHFPATDTSNGEADFIALEPSDVVFTNAAQVEVNLGVSQAVPVRIERQGGEAFPPGTRLTVTWTNGWVREMRVGDTLVFPGNVDLSGRTALDAVLTVDRDGTPSSGAVFLNVFVPNRDVARGRITLVDLAETVVLDFVLARVQLRTEGVPQFTGEEFITAHWKARLTTSASGTPLSGIRTGTSSGLDRDRMFGDASNAFGNACRSVEPRVNISVSGPLFEDAETDQNGEARMLLEYGSNGTLDRPSVEVLCRYLYRDSVGHTIEGFVTITTDQVLASLTADHTAATLRSVTAGQQEAFVFDTLDQLGAPLAAGTALEASCTAPAGNQVRFVPMGAPTTDAVGRATLTVQASTVDGSAFTEAVACTVGAHGVTRTVTLAPVLPAALDLAPDSLYLAAAEQTLGAEVAVEVTVRDAEGAVMPAVPVTLNCPTAGGTDSTQIVPVAPSTRTTDAQGRVRLLAAITQVGRNGLPSPVECTVSAGALSSTFTVAGQTFAVFGSGFESSPR